MWQDILENKEKIRAGNTTLTDITDGEAYRQYLDEGGFLANDFNISAIFSTDGVNLFSSTQVELWPIFLAISELSPTSRFARANMPLVAIWQGRGKPPYQQYMKVFSDEMNILHNEGFDFKHEQGRAVSKLKILCCTADLPAKAGVLNMTYFNGT